MSEVLPIPYGWFSIGLPEDFPPAQVVAGRWFDRELIVFRTSAGQLGALDAYCAHLGAHLGYGGRVEGGCVQCPFHGWTWAADGSCAGMPYGTRIPAAARTQSWPIIERDGVVLVWHGPAGPTWQMPSLGLDTWTSARVMRRTVRSHPQEVLENTVDFAHFRFVHQTHMMKASGGERIEGPRFEVDIQSAPEAVDPGVHGDDELLLKGSVFAHGPGLAGARITPEGMSIGALQRLYATPVADGTIQLIGLVNLRIDDAIDADAAEALNDSLAEQVFVNWDRDIEIWAHKRHLVRPAINSTERLIRVYRGWYSQYYTGDLARTASEGASA